MGSIEISPEHRHIYFVVSGFGQFCGVDKNPTEVLVRFLGAKGVEIDGASIISLDILKVAAHNIDQWVEHLVKHRTVNVRNQRVVFVHFGVDVRALAFKLEQRACNDASFRCPDEDGWQPQHQAIDESDGRALGSHMYTDLPVHELQHVLQRAGYKVVVSEDAGRFVCNWTYYRSLQCTREFQKRGSNWHSLFVHVPSFDEIDQETQCKFALAVLEAISKSLAV